MYSMLSDMFHSLFCSATEYGSVGLPIPTVDGVSLVQPAIVFGQVCTVKPVFDLSLQVQL